MRKNITYSNFKKGENDTEDGEGNVCQPLNHKLTIFQFTLKKLITQMIN